MEAAERRGLQYLKPGGEWLSGRIRASGQGLRAGGIGLGGLGQVPTHTPQSRLLSHPPLPPI